MCGTRRRQQTRGEKIQERIFMVCGCGVLICASPLILSYFAFEAVRTSDFVTEQKRKRELTPPKPVRRKRTLSICEETEKPKMGKSKGGITNAQTETLWFRLPLELRMQIYEEVVGDGEVHVVLRDGALNSFPCVYPDTHWDRARHCWYNNFLEENKKNKHVWRYHQPGIGVLPLLQSCRRVYTEMVDIVYSKPTFLLHDPASILAFTSSILPQRFNAITSLHIDIRRNGGDASFAPPLHQPFPEHASYRSLRRAKLPIRNSPFPPVSSLPDKTKFSAWNQVCHVITQMQGLKELKMDLVFRRLWWPEKHNMLMSDAMPKSIGKEAVEDVWKGLEILRGRRLARFEVCFTKLPVHALRWVEEDFVTVQLQE